MMFRTRTSQKSSPYFAECGSSVFSSIYYSQSVLDLLQRHKVENKKMTNANYTTDYIEKLKEKKEDDKRINKNEKKRLFSISHCIFQVLLLHLQ